MCKNACLVWEAVWSLTPRYTGEKGREERSQTLKFHCKNQHSEWTFTHFQLSPGLLHCHLKTPENKLINFSPEIRPSSCPFCNCEWCPTENKPCPSLSKISQLTQAHQVYLHRPLLYLQPHFLINCYHQSPDQSSKSWHYCHFEPDDSVVGAVLCIVGCLVALLPLSTRRQ